MYKPRKRGPPRIPFKDAKYLDESMREVQDKHLYLSQHPQEYIEKHVKIEDRDAPDGLAIPFVLWPRQVEVLQTFLSSRLTIVLKARQLGLTWLALAYATHRLLFRPGYAVVALSKKEDDAKELVRRVDFILRHMPQWMVREEKLALQVQRQAIECGMTQVQPMPYYSTTTLQVTVKHWNDEPSTFTAMSSAPDSARSFTSNLVILDEWAFQEWAQELWRAAFPTINRPTGGQVIGLSTASRGTLFEQVWDAAVDGRNGFTPVFLPWDSDPRRTPEWFEATKKAMTALGTEDYHAEYPASAAEAFAYSGLSVFEIETVTERIAELKQQYETDAPIQGDIACKFDSFGDPIAGTEYINLTSSGCLTIYETPKMGVPYVIGADTAEGGLDYSSAQVINNMTGKQAAKWKGHTDTDLFAKMLFSLGHYYNTALIAIETNFDLHPVKELERLKYPKQFWRETIDRFSRRKQKKHGWSTSSASRGPMIGNLVALVRETPELISDIGTLEEMLTFVRDEQGRPAAQEGKHDDDVMALAIAHAVRHQQKTGVPIEDEDELAKAAGLSEEDRLAVLRNKQFEQYVERVRQRMETQQGQVMPW